MTGVFYVDAFAQYFTEGNIAPSVFIKRIGDTSGEVQVEYGITSSEATAGQDFIGGVFTVTVPAGVDSLEVPVNLLDDAEFEDLETVVFSLISVDSGSLSGPRTTTVTILDDETGHSAPPAYPDVLEADYNLTLEPSVGGYDNFQRPIGIEFIPGRDLEAFVVTQAGEVKIVDFATDTIVSEALDYTDKVNFAGDRGMMSLELDPDFANNGYVYIFYVVDPPETQDNAGLAGVNGTGNRFAYLSRFTADPDNGYALGDEVILLGGAGQSLADISGGGAIDSTLTENVDLPESGRTDTGTTYVEDYIKLDSTSHAGGGLAFGPDGALYVAIGDGTAFNAVDPRTSSVQDVNSLSGKILRIDPMTGNGFPDNPFVDDGANPDLTLNRSKVFQLGLRNPFSLSIDDDGKLYIANTGWQQWESIFVSDQPGANYGWPWYEGGDDGNLFQSYLYFQLPEAAAFYEQVAEGSITITPAHRAFSHFPGLNGDYYDPEDPARDTNFRFFAVTAGDVFYDGDRYPVELQNDYLFTNFPGGQIFAMDVDDPYDIKVLADLNAGSEPGDPPIFPPAFFTQGPDGYIYYADVLSKFEVGRVLIEETNGAPVLIDADGADNIVAENAPTGAPVGVTANATGATAYDLVDATGASIEDGPFSINTATGVVLVADGTQLDFETAGSVTITVRATLADASTVTGDFTIDISDVDETPPPTWVTFTEATTATGTDNIDLFAGSPDDDVFDGAGGNDWLRGEGGSDTIAGDTGNDRIDGGTGADFLRGGLGSDWLTGGNTSSTGGDGEADVFFYTLGDIDATDVIRDFEVGLDKIGLDGASFGLAGGPLDAGRLFDESETVTGDGPALIYDDAIGRLYLDSDGAGAGGLQLMAILTGNPDLSHTDFEVFGGLPVSAVTDSDTAVNEIDADAVVGSPVAITASASDPDAGDTVSYSLTDNAGGQFAIDPSSGVVTLASPIPSGASSFSIEVTATSSDTSTSSSRFDIDVNTPPPTWVTFTEATTATGTDNIDLFAGSPDDDVFDGAGGNDWLRGEGGSDTIAGDTGNDRIDGGTGADFLRGGLGSDWLTGGNTSSTAAMAKPMCSSIRWVISTRPM